MFSGDATVLSPSASELLPHWGHTQRVFFPGERENQGQAGTTLLPVCEPWWVAPGYSPGRKFSASGQHCLLHRHCPALHSASTQGVSRNQPPNCPPSAPASCGRAILNILGKKSPILLKAYSENEKRGSRSWDSTVFPINSLDQYQICYFLHSWPKILQSTFERYKLDTVLFVNIPLPCR